MTKIIPVLFPPVSSILIFFFLIACCFFCQPNKKPTDLCRNIQKTLHYDTMDVWCHCLCTYLCNGWRRQTQNKRLRMCRENETPSLPAFIYIPRRPCYVSISSIESPLSGTILFKVHRIRVLQRHTYRLQARRIFMHSFSPPSPPSACKRNQCTAATSTQPYPTLPFPHHIRKEPNETKLHQHNRQNLASKVSYIQTDCIYRSIYIY